MSDKEPFLLPFCIPHRRTLPLQHVCRSERRRGDADRTKQFADRNPTLNEIDHIWIIFERMCARSADECENIIGSGINIAHREQGFFGTTELPHARAFLATRDRYLEPRSKERILRARQFDVLVAALRNDKEGGFHVLEAGVRGFAAVGGVVREVVMPVVIVADERTGVVIHEKRPFFA